MADRKHSYEDADKPPVDKKAKGKKQKTYTSNQFGTAAPKAKKPAPRVGTEDDGFADEGDTQ